MADIEAESLARRLTARNAAEIAQEIRELVETGSLSPGMRLPTIRDVANEVGVSVGTVAEAWGELRQEGLLITRRRGGTRITTPEPPQPASFPGWPSVDLLLCSPDPRLLPPIEPAVTKALKQPGINAWGREYIVEELQRTVEKDWPFHAEAWTAAGGGTEGLWLATRAAADPGQIIAVEEPAAPGYLGTLRDMDLTPVGVPVDEQGPEPEALRSAIDQGAVAFVYAPGGPFSDRHKLSEERAEQLKGVLEETTVTLVEDDALGPLSSEQLPSLGAYFPQRTIRVLALCRAFGMDLRTSVLGGARGLVERAVQARSGGVASNSRLLQYAALGMLQDRQVKRSVTMAQTRYAARRDMALSAFQAADLKAEAGPGSLVVWVEVPHEQAAALALGNQGIIVDVGSTSFVNEQSAGHLRLAVTQLPEDNERLAELAQLISRAAAGTLRATFV